MKALGGHNSDSMEQPAFVNQQGHEVTSKILNIVGFCEKFERVYSRGFMFENKLIRVHDPYGFQLLVMGTLSHGILEQVLVEIKNVGLMDLASLLYQLLIWGSKRFCKKEVIEGLAWFSRSELGSKMTSIVRQMEGTMLLNVNFAMKHDHSLGKRLWR